VTPTRLFDDRLDLDFEGVRIEIRDRGPANSPNDATIWLPRERACSRATSWCTRRSRT